MTARERADKAEALRLEVVRMGALGMGNYKAQLAEYRRILNDLLVLIRDDARAEDAALASSTHLIEG